MTHYHVEVSPTLSLLIEQEEEAKQQRDLLVKIFGERVSLKECEEVHAKIKNGPYLPK